MVDTNRRKRLAYHLRQLSVGRITNDAYEEAVMDDISFGKLPEHYYRAKEAQFDDPIIRPMLELSWCLYGDSNQKLIGRHKLNDEQLKDIARFILFLHSDLEYEWPYIDPLNPVIRLSFKEILLTILTFGQYNRQKRNERVQELEDLQSLENYQYWPFIKKEQYENQLRKQPFLNNNRIANA